MHLSGRAALSRRTFIALVAAGSMVGQVAWAETSTPGTDTTALAFDGTAALAAGDGIWRREADQGWQSIGEAGRVASLATHPDRPGLIYAGGSEGLHTSEDGGRSWTAIGQGLPPAPVVAVAVSAGTPETVYAAIQGEGLWVSRDSGATWEFAMDRPWLDEAEQDVLTLASVDAATGMGGIWIYAGTSAGLTRVPDCFCRWQEVQSGDAMDALAAGEAPTPERPLPEGEPVVALAVAPGAPEALYAAAGSAIWKSTDMGASWDPLHEAAASALAVDPADPFHVLAATKDGFIETFDGGQTWSAPASV